MEILTLNDDLTTITKVQKTKEEIIDTVNELRKKYEEYGKKQHTITVDISTHRIFMEFLNNYAQWKGVVEAVTLSEIKDDIDKCEKNKDTASFVLVSQHVQHLNTFLQRMSGTGYKTGRIKDYLLMLRAIQPALEEGYDIIQQIKNAETELTAVEQGLESPTSEETINFNKKELILS